MKAKNLKKGQGTLEYAIIIVVVVAALIAMQWYIKGGYQGKLRQAADEIGEQYSATHVTSNYTTITNTTQYENVSGGSFNDQTTMPTSTSNYTQNQIKGGTENLEGLNATTNTNYIR